MTRVNEKRDEEETCRAQYERPGGRQPGDRIVRCSMHLHHSGNHAEWYEGEVAAEWPQTPSHGEETCWVCGHACRDINGKGYVCAAWPPHGPCTDYGCEPLDATQERTP